MKRTLKLLLVPVLFLAMLLAVAPQESQAGWRHGRWGGYWGGYRGHYVARYHAPYHYGYHVYRPYVSHYYCAPQVYWGPRYSGYYYHGW